MTLEKNGKWRRGEQYAPEIYLYRNTTKIPLKSVFLYNLLQEDRKICGVNTFINKISEI